MLRNRLVSSIGQLDCLSVWETWDAPFMWPGKLKKSSIKGQTGHCSAPARKWRAIPGHPESPAITNQGEVWSSWAPGARVMVQSISPNVKDSFYDGFLQCAWHHHKTCTAYIRGNLINMNDIDKLSFLLTTKYV